LPSPFRLVAHHAPREMILHVRRHQYLVAV
jgi:hypothetical protein